MKLYTFEAEGRSRLGAESQGQLVDLAVAHRAMMEVRGKPGRALPFQMLDFLRAGEPAVQAAREVCAYMAKRPAVPVGERLAYAFEEVKILAPVPRPGAIA